LETLSLMSDVEIPVYVARAQVAAAIDMVVQLDRFSQDGSRKISRITEVHGLDEKNNYQLRDLYVCRLKGKTPEGRLVATLAPTGTKPTFASEPYERGMENLIDLSKSLWQPSKAE
jgi:pilus assembly protein CpaF